MLSLGWYVVPNDLVQRYMTIPKYRETTSQKSSVSLEYEVIVVMPQYVYLTWD